MGQIVVQGAPAALTIAMMNLAGSPAVGLTSASVTCQFRVEGDNVFASKALDGSNFTELGNGFYQINFTAADLSTVGSFIFILAGSGLRQASNEAQVVSTISTIPTTPAALPICRLTGAISSLGGGPVEGAAVSVRVLGMPTIEGVVGITDDQQTANTDFNGVFFLDLVQLSVVEVFIPRINYRRQLTVPALASANLFSSIP